MPIDLNFDCSKCKITNLWGLAERFVPFSVGSAQFFIGHQYFLMINMFLLFPESCLNDVNHVVAQFLALVDEVSEDSAESVVVFTGVDGTDIFTF